MTALDRYERLESLGLWREDATAQRRDVLVSFGKASLVISDHAERALAHWSLAAVVRLDTGDGPAIYAPGPGASERLEIDDAQMIEAVDAVVSAVARATPRPGRLRGLIGLSLLAATALAAVLLGPQALQRQALGATPDAQRVDLGNRILAELEARTGPVCAAPAGSEALARLDRRLKLERASTVLPAPLPGPLLLPGGRAVIGRALLTRYDDPAVAAAELTAATLSHADPLAPVLDRAGFGATITLLTTGTLPQQVLSDYAEAQLAGPTPIVPEADLIARLQALDLPAPAYAPVRTARGEDAALLLTTSVPEGMERVLSDADWIRLQSICDL